MNKKFIAYFTICIKYKMRLKKFGYYGIEDKNQNRLRYALTNFANLVYGYPESRINTEPI